ncbi:hypothetical protein [Streptomyces sp. NPDC093261]|uniref:hypothetical protein n=1 Tax=Streptomyces sp. NPDC093261 TaxID=3366037 RepID=UPI003810E228
MTTAKLSSSLPSGDANGLDPIIRKLIERPDVKQIAICVLDNRQTVTDNDSGATVPTLRIRRIEAVLRTDDLDVLQKIMRRAIETRTGAEVLPLDLEDDISEIFAQLAFDEDGQLVDADSEDADDDGDD